MHDESPQPFILELFKFAQECFWLLPDTLLHPVISGLDAAPSSGVAGCFVIVTASFIAGAVRILMSSIPVIVTWNSGNSNVFIDSLREWSDLQAGDKAFASIRRMAAAMSIATIIAALAMTLALLFVRFRWSQCWRKIISLGRKKTGSQEVPEQLDRRWFRRIQFGAIFRRSAVLISTAVTMMVLSEWIFVGVAQSRMPDWVLVILYLIVALVLPVYVVLCVPYFVLKNALDLTRLRAVIAVVFSCIVVSQVVNSLPTEFFIPETRTDPVLSAQLQALIRLSTKGQYRDAIELAHQAATSQHDSIQLDSLTLGVYLRAFEYAVRPKTSTAIVQNDAEWSSDIRSRYSDLVEVTDRFELKYSDVPGMLLKVAIAQLESGQCEKAQTVFEAVYNHRHAILMERIFAGLYLRIMHHEPNDLESILARFGPSDDATFVRSILASPGVGLGMFQYGYIELRNGIVALRKYEEELFQQSSQPRCAFVESKPPVQSNRLQKPHSR
jgi:hypothetical protein